MTYGLDEDELLWEKQDIYRACFTCLEPDTHLLFSIPGHIDEGTMQTVDQERVQITDVRSGEDLWSEPIPTSGSIAASSKSVITLGHGGTGTNQKWVCNSNDGRHTFNIAEAPSVDGTDDVKISPDSNFEMLIRSGSVRIRKLKECSGQLIDCHFQDWHGTPESFAFSPDSKAFIASRRQSVWLGEIDLLHSDSDSRCDSHIHCLHWDISSWLVEEADRIADFDYSPDRCYIAVVSYMGRILVFEQGKGFTEPLLVHDELLNRDLGKSSFTFKSVTCADWSQTELLLTGTAFGPVTPIQASRGDPAKPKNFNHDEHSTHHNTFASYKFPILKFEVFSPALSPSAPTVTAALLRVSRLVLRSQSFGLQESPSPALRSHRSNTRAPFLEMMNFDACVSQPLLRIPRRSPGMFLCLLGTTAGVNATGSRRCSIHWSAG